MDCTVVVAGVELSRLRKWTFFEVVSSNVSPRCFVVGIVDGVTLFSLLILLVDH